jgi:Uma2 family endonuclease
MTTITQQNLTFEKFIEQCPEEGFYELVDGKIVEMRATRQHDDIADFIADLFKDEIKRLNLNYVVHNTAVIRTVSKQGIEQGRNPDISVINKDIWRSNRSAYSALTEPIQLAVEVTSTNWKDDYIDKLDEYERLGIFEYWIVDYSGLGGREFLGNPKLPTVFVFCLHEKGKYQRTQFRDFQRIISPTFPELILTVEQILRV